jgi:hypothetical protein
MLKRCKAAKLFARGKGSSALRIFDFGTSVFRLKEQAAVISNFKMAKSGMIFAFLSATFVVIAEAVTPHLPKDVIAEVIIANPEAIPRTPLAFLRKLKEAGLNLKYHIVANGGAENVARGSFSCFGTASGHLGDNVVRDQDFSFGMFIEPNKDGYLSVQNDFGTRLLVEVIAKDYGTGVKDFWELIGDGKSADWHLRTNSFGIKSDVARVNMESQPIVSEERPLFGTIARCSGCHTSGDMVMKELDQPHNDWLQTNGADDIKKAIGHFKLKSGNDENDPEHQAAVMFSKSIAPEHLAKCVRESLKEGVKVQLQSSANKDSDKKKLRCVFAPLEMNLVSDAAVFSDRVRTNQNIEIPASFFVDQRICGPQPPIKVPSSVYVAALKALDSSFAEDETAGLLETQHSFLIPVRSFADERLIDLLLEQGKMDQGLLTAILNVDWTTPIYSNARLSLMQYVPDKYEDAVDLRAKLLVAVRSQPESERNSAANELLDNLTGNRCTPQFFKQRALDLLALCQKSASSQKHVESWLRLAAQRRTEIQAAQTSQNPRGRILEGGLGPGGFRRIFPQYKNVEPKPHELALDPRTATALADNSSTR